MFLLSETQHREVRVWSVLLQQGVPQDTQARQILPPFQGTVEITKQANKHKGVSVRVS